MTREPLAAFEDASFTAVVEDASFTAVVAEGAESVGTGEEVIDESHLRGLVADHQQSVRDLPGVDDIVYEWRRSFPVNPVVRRTDSAYFLVVEPWVWDEFVAALSLSPVEGEALRAVHDRQFRRAVDADPDSRLETDADGTLKLGDWDALVLTRP